MSRDLEALIRTNWRVVQEAEPLGRTMIRLTAGTLAPQADLPGPRRGYNRIEWIEKAVEPVRKDLGKQRFERLVSGLALCFGWEALLVLRDVRGLDNKQAEQVSLWAARTLLDAALTEARDHSANRKSGG